MFWTISSFYSGLPTYNTCITHWHLRKSDQLVKKEIKNYTKKSIKNESKMPLRAGSNAVKIGAGPPPRQSAEVTRNPVLKTDKFIRKPLNEIWDPQIATSPSPVRLPVLHTLLYR